MEPLIALVGVTLFAGVILNYLRRRDADGT